jgi:hypothetical protein
LNSDIRFSLEHEGLLIEIRAVYKDQDKGEAGYGIYELHFSSSRDSGERLAHYWPAASFPTEQEDLIAALEHALDEEGIIEHILEAWTRLDTAGENPRWAKKTFKRH